MLEEIKKELTKLRQVLGKVAYYSRGAYDSSFLYKKHDVVTYQGSSYVSLKETQDNLPTNEEYWMLLAKKGDKGDTGPQGIQGIQGIQGEKGDKGDKGDTYEVTENDLQTIASQITEDANSEFNNNVTEKTNEFNTNASTKTNAFDTNATSKTTAFNTNAETKITAYNSNATNKLTDYNDNATAKVEEFNNSVDSIRKDIDDNTSRIKRLETNLDVGEASGESINVKDSAYSEAIEIESDGGWNQKTTTGKNILDCSKIETGTLNGITCSYDKVTQIITLDGECTTDNTVFLFNIGNYNVEKNKTTLTIYHQGGTASGLGSVRSFDSNYGSGMVLRFVDTLSNPVLSKTSAENYEAKWTNLRFNNGDTASNLKIKIMLAHDADTIYEPYTGGEPSPNLDYKQPAEVIEAGNYEVTTCNKNIWNYPNYSFLPAKASTWYSLSGESPVYSSYLNNIKTKITLDAGTYSVSYKESKNINNFQIIDINEKLILKSNESQFTLKEKSVLIPRILNVEANNETYIYDLQIERNDSAATYESHQESKLLFTIPEGEFAAKLSDSVTDKIIARYNDDDKHYHLFLEKNVGRSSYTFNGVSSNGIDRTLKMFNILAPTRKNVKPNIPTNDSSIKSERTLFTHGTTDGKRIRLLIPFKFLDVSDDEVETITNSELLARLKAKYGDISDTVYFPLAEPYTLDLGIVDMPLTYPNETNVFNNFPLPVEMKLSYYRNPHLTIEQLQSRIEELENNTVKNTDYATLSKAGIVKANYNFATNSDDNGNLIAGIRSLDGYNSLSDNAFVSKGTLEAVLRPIREQINQLVPSVVNEEVIENDISSEQ